MSKHTEGPWKFSEAEFGDFNICEEAGLAVAVCVQNGFRSPHETRANTHLIAAAPDLLEALEQVRMHKCMFDDDKSFEASCNKVNAAIGKANGES